MLLTNQQRGWFFLFSFKTCGTTTPNCFYFAHANVVPWLTNSWINFRGLFWIEAFKWSSKSNGLCVENRLCQNGPLRNEKTICALYFRQWCALPKRYKWIQWQHFFWIQSKGYVSAQIYEFGGHSIKQ